MNTRRLLAGLATAVLFSVLVPTSSVAQVNEYGSSSQCLPGIVNAFQDHPGVYGRLYATLLSQQRRLRNLLDDVHDQATYEALLGRAKSIASSIGDGRMLVALPDGTVVLDTARPDDPTNTMSSGNSYEHFVEKTVNENHNSRVAILSAQQYPCGVGLERKVSTTTNTSETYFALRLGKHLDSSGTARLSTTR